MTILGQLMAALRKYIQQLGKTSHRLCKELYHNTILLMISGSILGFVLALLIFFWENLPFVKGAALVDCQGCHLKTTIGIFNQLPDFLTWVLLFTLHTGVSLALGFAAIQKIRVNTLGHFKIGAPEIISSLALVLLMVVISSMSYVIPFNSGKYYDWPRTPLNHQWIKLVLLLAISILSASCAVLGLILIGCIARKHSLPEPTKESIKIYFDLKEQMEVYLMITGYILTSGLITVYFLKETEKALGLSLLLDDHGLALFGLLFTIFIGITFIPCKLSLSEMGRKIASRQTGPAPENPTELKTWVESNEAIEKYLQLKFDAVETLRYAIPVLSPILSTLLPVWFGHKA